MKAYIYKYLLDERVNIFIFTLILCFNLVYQQFGIFVYLWVFTFQTPSDYIDRLGFDRKVIFRSGLFTTVFRFIILTVLTFLLYAVLSSNMIPLNFRADVFSLISTLSANALVCLAFYIVSNSRVKAQKKVFKSFIMIGMYLLIIMAGAFILSPFMIDLISYPVERLMVSYLAIGMLFIFAACLHYINLKEYAYVEN